jgi:hypothetical protein
MKHLIRIFILTYFLLPNLNFAQELELFIKKGFVTVSDSKISSGQVLVLKKTDELNTNPGSVCLLKQGGKIVELTSGKKYFYKDLLKMLTKSTSFSNSFIKMATNQQPALKKSAGITTRNFDPKIYEPNDDLFILTDTLLLSVGSFPLKLLDDITLVHNESKLEIKLSKNQLSHRIRLTEMGTYTWSYTVLLGSEKNIFENYFIVPSSEIKMKMLNELVIFNSNLTSFSDSVKELLLQEYAELNMIYLSGDLLFSIK